MAPAGDQDHREMWAEIHDTKQELAKHLGACEIRHAEIIRRQDDSMRDRHAMNIKIDDLRTKFNAAQIKILLAALSGLGAVVLTAVNIIIVLMRK